MKNSELGWYRSTHYAQLIILLDKNNIDLHSYGTQLTCTSTVYVTVPLFGHEARIKPKRWSQICNYSVRTCTADVKRLVMVSIYYNNMLDDVRIFMNYSLVEHKTEQNKPKAVEESTVPLHQTLHIEESVCDSWLKQGNRLIQVGRKDG